MEYVSSECCTSIVEICPGTTSIVEICPGTTSHETPSSYTNKHVGNGIRIRQADT